MSDGSRVIDATPPAAPTVSVGLRQKENRYSAGTGTLGTRSLINRRINCDREPEIEHCLTNVLFHFQQAATAAAAASTRTAFPILDAYVLPCRAECIAYMTDAHASRLARRRKRNCVAVCPVGICVSSSILFWFLELERAQDLSHIPTYLYRVCQTRYRTSLFSSPFCLPIKLVVTLPLSQVALNECRYRKIKNLGSVNLRNKWDSCLFYG